ncbi:hypothetical protein JW979_03905 [bacterium]|nr:hypothetical protein [candidate division CSSED10-310 bacterium]
MFSNTLRSKSNNLPQLEKLYNDALKYSQEQTYGLPSSNTLSVFENMFLQCLQIHESEQYEMLVSLKEIADQAGFKIVRAEDKWKNTHTVIMEKDGIRRGSGFYVFKDNFRDHRPVIFQTPHARSDEYTGRISINAYMMTTASAFYSSTMRRDVKLADDITDMSAADPAHNARSYFHAASRITAQFHPDLLMIQFHGFKKDTDVPGRQFDIIVSCGRENTADFTKYQTLFSVIKKRFSKQMVGCFGVDTDALGALTNIQGQYVNNWTAGIFFHLEMDHEFRKNLVTSKKLQQKWVKCLNKVIRTYEKF